MNILIYGAGVIGATYGWQLHEAGHEITMLVREGTGSKYQDGIHIQFQDERGKTPLKGETVFRPKITEMIAGDEKYELIMVCVRSNQVDAVMPALAEAQSEADILFFQNNWWGDERIRSFLPAGRYFFGFSRLAGGWRDEQGVHCILFNAPGMSTMLGEKDGIITPRIRRLGTALQSAGLKPEISRDILSWLKFHYVEYLGATGAILKAGTVKAFASQTGLVREAILATREALRVCRARGIPLKSAPFNLRLYSLPLPLLVWLGRMQYQDANIQSFFEENIHTGLGELSDQFCNVLEEARHSGVKTPVLDGFEPFFKAKLAPSA